ncbi:response regulator [Rhodocyclus purpureus]|uniref:response regulator n=1 Tax=Rhodocyclus purpureus TaxID=1067 RepID=UPI001913E166|nr:response regulator [Rhodocyclus purpureus]
MTDATLPRASILIVDDSTTNLKLLVHVLRDEYDLRTATSGPEALALLGQEARPDLILLDLMMPGMDGYQVCAALKADAATRDIPVIFVTAKIEDESRSLALGAVDFIQKPINVAVVRARVRLHIDLARQAASLRQSLIDVRLAQDRSQVLSTAIEQSPTSVVITDADCRIQYVNPRFVAESGYSVAEAIGRNPRFLSSGLTERATFASMWSHLLRGEAWTGEIINRRKSGALFHEEIHVSPVKDAQGKTVHYVAVKLDITERKRLEQERQDAMRRLELATEAAHLGISTWDLSEATMSWDSRMCDWYEVPEAMRRQGIRYEFWRSRVHPDDADAFTAALQQTRQAHTPWQQEFRIVVPSGRIRELQTSYLFETAPSGKTPRMIGVTRDVTPQRELEATLRAAKQKADAANEAKGNFLANMSHEIRTPMNAVIGLSHLLLEGELDATQRDYLERIHVSATALLNIINDVLDYSKVEAGHLELESIPLSLDEVLARTIAVFAIRAEQKQVTLAFEVSPELPPRLQGDPLRLQQVINNLVENALKFTESGSVRIKVDCLGQEAESVVLRVAVSDTGIGIDRASQESLFSPFHQADNSTTRKYGGTGLGLSICKRLVELMGGEIGVDSRVGTGSTFWFTVRLGALPAPDAEPLPTAELAKASSLQPERLARLAELTRPIHGARVLVVDDNSTNLLLVGEYLKKMALSCETADNGRRAVELASSGRFAAILMDLQMPEMDGFSAAQAIRAGERTRNAAAVPIIALTAAAMPQDREASEAAGMNDHLSKPVDARQLARTLLQWIPGRAPAADELPAPRPVLELGHALRQLDDDPLLLQRLLASFHSDFADAPERLRKAIERQEFDVAIRLVHTIKGLAPTIGATILHALAVDFEQDLQRQDGALEGPFTAALREVLAAIATPLPAAGSDRLAAGSAIDAAALLPRLKKLGQLLLDGRSQAREACMEIDPMLSGSALQEPWAQIARAIARFDFGAALTGLESLAATINRRKSALAITMSERPPARTNLLIVDDNPSNIELLIALLENDYDLSIASSGRQALALLAEGYPRDLILLDVMMPEMDGFAVCQKLKADKRTADVPVIFLSAATDTDDKLRGFAIGAVDYITKPFSAREVRARVAVHLANRQDRQRLEAMLGEGIVAQSVNREQDLFNRAVTLLKAHLSQPPSLTDLAHELGTNARKLTEVFRKQVGMTVFDFVLELRLEKARLWLDRGELQVRTIADRIGYRNAGDFTRAFRRRYGVSPSEYRRQASAD